MYVKHLHEFEEMFCTEINDESVYNKFYFNIYKIIRIRPTVEIFANQHSIHKFHKLLDLTEITRCMVSNNTSGDNTTLTCAKLFDDHNNGYCLGIFNLIIQQNISQFFDIQEILLFNTLILFTL